MDIWNLNFCSNFLLQSWAEKLNSNLPQSDGKHQELSVGYSKEKKGC